MMKTNKNRELATIKARGIAYHAMHQFSTSGSISQVLTFVNTPTRP